MRYQFVDCIPLALIATLLQLYQFGPAVIPAGPDQPLPDIVGIYDSSSRQDGHYKVNIFVGEDGTRFAHWRDSEGELKWFGRLTEKDGRFHEVYGPPGLPGGPWIWEIKSADPLRLVGDGWMLERKIQAKPVPFCQ